MYSEHTALSAPCPAKKWPPSMNIRMVFTGPSLPVRIRGSLPDLLLPRQSNIVGVISGTGRCRHWT
jgi:hypothetical protein